MPLYIYKTVESFAEAMTQYVRRTLQRGSVRLAGHRLRRDDDRMRLLRRLTARRSRRDAASTAADFRKLTPLVLMRALERAGTVVCEPIVRVGIEIPTETVGAVLAAVARLGAAVADAVAAGRALDDRDVLPAARAQDLRGSCQA